MHLEDLIFKVEGSAEWRANKAKQYPDDIRNINSAQSLERLAEKLRALPDNDENVVAYEAAMDRLVDSDANQTSNGELVEHENAYIGRFGFDRYKQGEIDPAGFLSGLTETYQEWLNEAQERIAEEDREQAYERAKETADDAAKEAAHEAAKEAAGKAAEEAAEEAYKETYEESYKEAYEEAYCDALIDAA
jgi:hypothetical protein